MAQNPSEGKLIYHITHINNLPSILKVGLLSRKKLLRNPSLSFTDIADSEILSKREQYKEGYMGKGIAYQFKLKFPNNNKDYIKACKSGVLRPGKLHFYREAGKIIMDG